ncbi:cellulase family glycosylhydrolase [Xylella taiwanensis]|uniref:Cellulase n=1 Tax=Xylella taiwanensis TaxID=1444770 RepID=Z9JNH1_9GAMM|nr:expansin EXLX1 family cellulose-binding protein [Xylella taiwanensis]AXI84491.1 endoglucanase [Xylella taiwanensis]EWS79361.1 cellulase [Xylella taiwanensis]MCD8455392.1 cellulase family glycosylhydrolase [Xylella taiwanensis]MCD8457796.1 cellulase family glycosylhydrolase [Xylella taiwanensis]MCD8459932.1 cellulase family glycosylhydrolase [Xylella taiwanensis]
MRRLTILLWLAVCGCVVSVMYGGTVEAQNPVPDAHFVEALHGVNWRGLETLQHMPQGLDQRNWREVLDQMQKLGINAIRLPLCSASLHGAMPVNLDLGRNPDLKGRSALELADAIVDEAGQRGMRVLLAYHGLGCALSQDPLWYSADEPEHQWIADLQFIASRYRAQQKAVIGVDLADMAYSGALQGSGDLARDWNRAAERAAAAILAIAPDWLIGVQSVAAHPPCLDAAAPMSDDNLQSQHCVPLHVPDRNVLLLPRLTSSGLDTEAERIAWHAELAALVGKHPVLPNSLDATDAVQLGHRVDALLALGIRDGFHASWMTSAQVPFGMLDKDGRTPRVALVAQLHRWWGVSRVDVATESNASTHQTGTDTSECVASDSSMPIDGWDTSFRGTATYTYSGYKGGALMLDPIQSDAHITALNPTQLNLGGVPAAMAGAYLRVQGPKGSTTVYVTDRYPTGSSGGLDLSPNAFASIGNIAQGRIPVQWKVVSAPVSGNVMYRVKKGSSGWWAAIQVRQHRYPVLKLEVCQDGAWLNLPKKNYNYFVGSRLGNQPLSIRMTDIRGQTLIDTLPGLPKHAASKAYAVDGNVQFSE